jgi:hypothetical protein
VNGELKLAITVRCCSDYAVGRVADGGVRRGELRVVDGIEAFRPESENRGMFDGQTEVALDAEVAIVHPWGA